MRYGADGVPRIDICGLRTRNIVLLQATAEYEFSEAYQLRGSLRGRVGNAGVWSSTRADPSRGDYDLTPAIRFGGNYLYAADHDT